MTIDLQKDISDLQGSTTGIREEMDGRFTGIGDQLNKQMAEAVKIANRSRYGSEQASEFAPLTKAVIFSKIRILLNLAPLAQ